MKKPGQLLLALALLGSATAAAATEPVIGFDPPLPGPGDPLRISVGYLTNCFLSAEVEVIGARIDVTAIEGCICPASLPEPFAFTVEAGSLDSGAYTVRFLVARSDEGGSPCQGEPELRSSRDLVVSPSGSLPAFSVEPPEPSAADPVQLILESPCPSSFEDPLVQGHLFLLPEIQSMIAAPCSQLAVWRSVFSLGLLGPGTYTVLHIFDDKAPSPRLIGVHAFDVAPTESSSAALSLRQGRFGLSVLWSDGYHDIAGAGQPVPLSDDAGYFWFFRPGNVELVAKVLNGCKINGHYWVFASGLTDLQLELTVQDLQADAYRTYTSPQGTAFEPVLDTTAFPTCP